MNHHGCMYGHRWLRSLHVKQISNNNLRMPELVTIYATSEVGTELDTRDSRQKVMMLEDHLCYKHPQASSLLCSVLDCLCSMRTSSLPGCFPFSLLQQSTKFILECMLQCAKLTVPPVGSSCSLQPSLKATQLVLHSRV